MKGYQMEKETCIYNDLNKNVPQNTADKERLRKCISFFSEKYGVELFFCDIKGNRWSYMLGSKELVSNYSKFKLCSSLGVCIENTTPDISCEIASSLEQFFMNY